MRITLNRSPKTVEQYETDLILFFRFLTAQRMGISLKSEEFDAIRPKDVGLSLLQSVTSSDIYEFLMYSADVRGNHAKTRARKLSFFKFMTSTMHYLPDNPAKDIASPTVRPGLPKYLSVEESMALLQTVQTDYESRTRVRDYAILTLFLNCGMRLSELCGMNLSKLNLKERVVRIVGKGNKERQIHLNDACVDALEAYLAVRPTEGVKGEHRDAVFLSRQKRRINGRTVELMMKKYLKNAQLNEERYTPHKLRHTAATLMFSEGGVDVRTLKEILGHEQLNTTQIYTHIESTELKIAAEANPLSKLDFDKS